MSKNASDSLQTAILTSPGRWVGGGRMVGGIATKASPSVYA